MGKIAFVFSGQGAQYPGMAKELYDNYPVVKNFFDEAEAIRPGTLDMMFNGTAEELMQTENTQPCLYLADIAPALCLMEKGIMPDAVAGFSLGEIPALAIAGAYSLLDGFRIACDRGRCLGKAAKQVSASMYAVMKLEDNVIEDLCKNFNNIYPVNYNCPGQLVVSGDSEELLDFSKVVAAAGGRTIQLKVSGAFHSPYMNPAAEEFAECLKAYELKQPALPVYANLTAKPYEGNVAEMMTNQVNHPVRWTATVKNMNADGIDTFYETGVGDVLKKLIARTLPECTAQTADAVLKA